MATVAFQNSPTFINGYYTADLIVNGFLPDPYIITYIVQLATEVKYFYDQPARDPRFISRDFSQQTLVLHLTKQLGSYPDVKFIDVAISNANERPSNATGQRRFLYRLSFTPNTGATQSIFVGLRKPITGAEIVNPFVTSNSTVPLVMMSGQSTTITTEPAAQNNTIKYFHFTVRLPNNIKDFIITYDTLIKLSNLNWGSITYRYEPLIGTFPSYVGVSSFNDVVNFAGLNQTSQPPTTGQPPTGGQPPTTEQPTNFSFGNIFGYIVGGGVAVAFLGGLFHRRSKRKK